MTKQEKIEIEQRLATKYIIAFMDGIANTPLGVFRLQWTRSGIKCRYMLESELPSPWYDNEQCAMEAAQSEYAERQSLRDIAVLLTGVVLEDSRSLSSDEITPVPITERLGQLEGIRKTLYVGTCTTDPNGIAIAPSVSAMTMIWDLFTAISPSVTISEASALWIGIKMIEEYQKRRNANDSTLTQAF